MRNKLIGLALIVALSGGVIAYNSYAGSNHEEKSSGHQEGEDGHGEEHGDKTQISKESAEAMKIAILPAGAATVHQTVSLTGKITLNQNRTAQVKARFAGIVRDVKKGIGDKVKKGETLALIESNESLQVYSVTAPLDGIVIARNTNIGDVADADAIFIVADLKELWAEFFIFSRDLDRIKPGQKIDVKSLTDGTSTEAVLNNLLPTAESSSQTVVARVVIDNADNQWRAGMTVRGDVVLSEKEVPLAVKTSAIQRQEGTTVVYVQKGETFEMRKVELGEADREWTEILSGLNAGESYVATNSFIIKADIGKSAAEHED
jgi:cobalt-zinc-cadmium efflux system membrane fusion protein